MTRTPHLLLLAGVTLVLYGYWRLAVPPDALYGEVLARAREGVLSVAGGGGLLMVWLAKR
ncbi:hypothetical protein [Trichlorobacter sp.]|jgi:hypothetical protein|uniref:hypothetical protein n=1 Tax=Trichlorobacter sp. TaxID=2911007 RepID=UPI002A35A2E9|nr:hypothetical protein [Trichlorobacter sp.]MDY0385443.1 hypothetical protein [Trichlorobacter sp.]